MEVDAVRGVVPIKNPHYGISDWRVREGTGSTPC